MDRIRQLPHNYPNKYLTEVRAEGRYAFTLRELKNRFTLSYPALKQNLYRLKLKKEVAQIWQGFYVIISPEYSKQGMLPPYLFINDLMKLLDKPYYMGLLSATTLHGTAHQQLMGYAMIIQSPVPRSIKRLKIVFFSRQDFLQDGIVQKKTPAGYINVLSPELTALEFFDYIHRFGINRITTVLQELTEAMKPTPLLKIARQYPNMTALQRFGYILERGISAEKLSASLWKALNERTCFPVPLSPQKGKRGETDSKWKVIKNMEIENDL